MLIQSLYQKSHYLGAFIICHQRGGSCWIDSRVVGGGGGHKIQAPSDRGGHRIQTPSDRGGHKIRTPSDRGGHRIRADTLPLISDPPLVIINERPLRKCVDCSCWHKSFLRGKVKVNTVAPPSVKQTSFQSSEHLLMKSTQSSHARQSNPWQPDNHFLSNTFTLLKKCEVFVYNVINGHKNANFISFNDSRVVSSHVQLFFVICFSATLWGTVHSFKQSMQSRWFLFTCHVRDVS